MIIDKLSNSNLYSGISEGISDALQFLISTDLFSIKPCKHIIDGDNLFAIVQEYTTLDPAEEKMESHSKHIDVQYVISGVELVGHAFGGDKAVFKPYDDKEDYTLYADQPDYFSRFEAGTFMVFFPGDLHMPCIQAGGPSMVKKIVVKVKIQNT